jgi:hypothetical protein
MWADVQLTLLFESDILNSTVVGSNLCVKCPLEVKSKGIRGVVALEGKEACIDHAINTVSQWQWFVARCLMSAVPLICLAYAFVFPSTRKLLT